MLTTFPLSSRISFVCCLSLPPFLKLEIAVMIPGAAAMRAVIICVQVIFRSLVSALLFLEFRDLDCSDFLHYSPQGRFVRGA